jgi:N12 class adenine-specific DNA methylase
MFNSLSQASDSGLPTDDLFCTRINPENHTATQLPVVARPPLAIVRPPLVTRPLHVVPRPPMAQLTQLARVIAAPTGRPSQTEVTKFAPVRAVLNARNASFPERFTGEDQSGKKTIEKARIEANISAIALSNGLAESNQLPDAQQQTILAGYSGWGGLAEAFWPNTESFKRLKVLLSEDGLMQIKAGLLNAHYTPRSVVGFVYDCLKKLGVQPKTILDPCTGVGGFFGHMPAELKATATLVGCELDATSAQIAKQLSPDASIETTAFEKMRLPNDYFDLAIGNVPFGDYHVFDAETPTVRNRVHNAFFAKAMRKVKKNGIIAFITSTGTMDSLTGASRKYLASECNLLAAFRFPATVFEKIASTSVASDLLIFQRRDGQASNAIDWLDTESIPTSDQDAFVITRNTWWSKNPEALLGVPTAISTKHAYKFGVTGKSAEHYMPTALATLQCLPKAKIDLTTFTPWSQWLSNRHLGDTPVGAWVLEDGKLSKMLESGLTSHGLSELQHSRVAGMCQIRDVLVNLLKLQSTSDSDEQLLAPRGKLNMLYDLFVKKHGPINAKVNRRLFYSDGSWPILAASEHYVEKTGVATKTEVFLTRTVRPMQAPASVGNIAEAVMASMAYRLCLDLEFMANLLTWGAEEVVAALARDDLAYWCPEKKVWEIKSLYLSGDIVQKIDAATLASRNDASMVRNLDALEAAKPERVAIQEIEIQMGATFIPLQLVQDFVLSIFGCAADTTIGKLIQTIHHPIMGKWKIKAPKLSDTAAQTRWATERVGLADLLQTGLNGGNITIHDTVIDSEGKERRVVNANETAIAREKLFLVKQEFDRWMRADAARSDAIEESFNVKLNRFIAPTYDGSHLKVPGLNLNIVLRPLQKNGIWRSMVGGNTLIAHSVGAGKTLEAICIAQLRKSVGLARTSVLAVPNHLLHQFSAEYMRAFPLAHILMVGTKQMSAEQRAITLSKIAMGNFDAVIMVHTAYTAIPVGEAVVQSIRDDINNDLNAASLGADDANTVKSIERQRKMANELVDRFAARQTSATITWDELGIDSLVVDESQAFKNLHFSTSLQSIAGLNTNFSLRAYDCFVKTRAVQRRNGERGGVVFTTATPIANTIAEMFHLMRYMMYPKLKELGMQHFDQWRANFGKTVTAVEMLPEGGGFRMRTRFAQFHNVPQLMALFWSFADVVLSEDLDIPVPKLVNGRPTVVAIEPTRDQQDYMLTLVERAEKIRSTDRDVRPDPKDDNMLLITSDGKKAALDMRCVHPSYKDDPKSKLNMAIADIFAVWERTKQERLTQMVFCDLGTPGGAGFCVYDDICNKLVKMGVPRGEIAYAHDAKTDAQKLALWQAVNDGEVRIVLGSTAKMGTGTNAQERLCVLYDLDAPYRPDEVEQRAGRILRQGNRNQVVDIRRYVTEGTFDAYIWQLLETKLRFILQVLSGKSRLRTIEDIDSRAMSYAEIKALATGNPKLIERANLQQVEAMLSLKQKSHREMVANASMQVRRLREILPFAETQASNVEMDSQNLATHAEAILEIKGVAYHAQQHRGEAADALNKVVSRVRAMGTKGAYQLGAFRKMQLEIHIKSSHDEWTTRASAAEFVLRGHHVWSTEVGDSPLGNLTRLLNLAQAIEIEELTKAKNRVARHMQEINSFEAMLEQRFEQACELADVRRKRKDLEIELGMADDDGAGLGEEVASAETVE